MSDTTVRIRLEDDGGSKGRWVATVDGVEGEGEMTFSRMSERSIIIDHTGVPETMAGMGVAKALYENLVKEAREKGFKIVPLCPYVKAQIDKHPEHRDIVL
ncbi:MAG: GNAT family N-acetyltransferase [Pseudomonadota bacterium]